MQVLLLGLMGSGKTTVGRLLAADLGVPWLDNDDEVARAEGRTVVELAAEGGEVLHDAEERLVRRLVADDGSWVAGVPAGAVDRPGLVDLLQVQPLTAYLHVPPEVLVARVAPGPARPWLASDASAFVRASYERRDAVLRAAAATVVDGTRPPADVAGEVARALRLRRPDHS